MNGRTPLIAVALAATAITLMAQETKTTQQTTQQNPDGSIQTTTKTTTIIGSVVRYSPGQTIVIRSTDGKTTTYAIGGSVEVPAEVQVGKSVTVSTEPASDGSGPAVVTRIQTTSVNAQGQTKTTTERTETNALGQTKTTTITGSVVRYSPGQTIVIRSTDGKTTTYAIGPSVEVPAEVQVGKSVTVSTEPASDGSGPAVVTRIQTTSVNAQGQTKTTTERTETNASGQTKTTTTTVYGMVTAFEPGQSISIERPGQQTVTYTIDSASQLPPNLAVGKSVTIQTTTVSGSQSPVVRRITYRTTTKVKTSNQ